MAAHPAFIGGQLPRTPYDDPQRRQAAAPTSPLGSDAGGPAAGEPPAGGAAAAGAGSSDTGSAAPADTDRASIARRLFLPALFEHAASPAAPARSASLRALLDEDDYRSLSEYAEVRSVLKLASDTCFLHDAVLILAGRASDQLSRASRGAARGATAPRRREGSPYVATAAPACLALVELVRAAYGADNVSGKASLPIFLAACSLFGADIEHSYEHVTARLNELADSAVGCETIAELEEHVALAVQLAIWVAAAVHRQHPEASAVVDEAILRATAVARDSLAKRAPPEAPQAEPSPASGAGAAAAGTCLTGEREFPFSAQRLDAAAHPLASGSHMPPAPPPVLPQPPLHHSHGPAIGWAAAPPDHAGFGEYDAKPRARSAAALLGGFLSASQGPIVRDALGTSLIGLQDIASFIIGLPCGLKKDSLSAPEALAQGMAPDAAAWDFLAAAALLPAAEAARVAASMKITPQSLCDQLALAALWLPGQPAAACVGFTQWHASGLAMALSAAAASLGAATLRAAIVANDGPSPLVHLARGPVSSDAVAAICRALEATRTALIPWAAATVVQSRPILVHLICAATQALLCLAAVQQPVFLQRFLSGAGLHPPLPAPFVPSQRALTAAAMLVASADHLADAFPSPASGAAAPAATSAAQAAKPVVRASSLAETFERELGASPTALALALQHVVPGPRVHWATVLASPLEDGPLAAHKAQFAAINKALGEALPAPVAKPSLSLTIQAMAEAVGFQTRSRQRR